MINKVKATGKLVWTGRGVLGYNEIIVRIKKKGQKGFNVRFVLEDTLTPDLLPGTKVDIDGFVRSVKMSDLDGRTKDVQFLSARSVVKSHAMSALQKEFGIKTYNKEIDDLSIILEGKVLETRIYGRPNQLIRINVENRKKRSSVIALTVDSDSIPNLNSILNRGDTVIVSATTQPSTEFERKEESSIRLFIDDIGRKKKAVVQTASEPAKKEKQMNPKRSVENTIEILPPDDKTASGSEDSDFNEMFD